jgi:hypothetical protein
MAEVDGMEGELYIYPLDCTSVSHVLRRLDRKRTPGMVQARPQKASQMRPLFCADRVEIVSTISDQTGVVLTISSPVGGRIES